MLANLQTYLGEEMYNSYYESLHYDDVEVKDDEDVEEELELTELQEELELTELQEELAEMDSEVLLDSEEPN